MAESETELQKLLDCFQDYTDVWKLKVNVDKTKVVVFSRRRPSCDFQFLFNGKKLDIVDEFNYLGIVLTRTGNFNKTKQFNVEKATMALYEVLRLGRLHNLSICSQLDLFDKMVKPILLYGCEVWGIGNNDMIERVHLKFCKLLLSLKTSTPSYMIYGELGRYPIDLDIKTRLISFWGRLNSGKETKLSYILYKLCYHMSINDNVNFSWLNRIKTILNECGIPNVWETQSFINCKWLVSFIKLRLKDQYVQVWHSLLENSPKALNYKLFKDFFGKEDYFEILGNKLSIDLCRFRTTNHKLPIEQGRWNNIVRNNRICLLCNKNDIGELHYILECKYFKENRKHYLSHYYLQNANIVKYKEIMSSKNKSVLIKLCKFIKIINTGVCAPG